MAAALLSVPCSFQVARAGCRWRKCGPRQIVHVVGGGPATAGVGGEEEVLACVSCFACVGVSSQGSSLHRHGKGAEKRLHGRVVGMLERQERMWL